MPCILLTEILFLFPSSSGDADNSASSSLEDFLLFLLGAALVPVGDSTVEGGVNMQSSEVEVEERLSSPVNTVGLGVGRQPGGRARRVPVQD